MELAGIRFVENPSLESHQVIICSGGKVYAYNAITQALKVVSERLPDGSWTHELSAAQEGK